MSEPTCWDTRGWMHLKSRLTSRTRLMVYLREDVFVKQIDQIDKFDEIPEDVFEKQVDQLDKAEEIIDNIQGVQ